MQLPFPIITTLTTFFLCQTHTHTHSCSGSCASKLVINNRRHVPTTCSLFFLDPSLSQSAVIITLCRNTRPFIHSLSANSEGTHPGRHTTPSPSPTLTLIHTYERFRVTNPPTGVFLDTGRKPENPDEAHMDTRRT